MRRIFIVFLLLHVSLFAETLVLENFKTNVFAKSDKKPVEAMVALIFEGKEVKLYEYKVVDALNIVIGSYFAEDLVTSRGKELFKATLIAYAKKTHGLVIDAVYIKELTVKTNPSTKEIVDAIKKEGVFQQQQQQNNAPKQQQQSQQLNLAPPLPKRSLIPEENAVNF
ncbi:hypothetical protein [Sulfurospirillum multivorans]|uniref:Periplasmic protein n=2 Tax=Sulfurospirillum multivorans TaxID=66821 RepID=A0AA86AM86_SULMK|nr:hypothetical protein [Sulfurospirillum multivorans]AHJ13281.1 hypothetical protein SMUL_2026 [Sulfurospirillum multivorans DSM 12446]QEH06771.1 hypothetical protein SMN_2006 [Sulfurospirillum multivorans]